MSHLEALITLVQCLRTFPMVCRYSPTDTNEGPHADPPFRSIGAICRGNDLPHFQQDIVRLMRCVHLSRHLCFDDAACNAF